MRTRVEIGVSAVGDYRHVAQVVVERGHCRCLATWVQAKEAT